MPTLLVIDDEQSVRYSFQRVFEGDAVAVRTAATAAEGLEQLREQRPDVVVLDLQLPDRSGLDVFREIQAIDPKRPVIFITAHGTTETAIEAMKGGAFDYLVKPVDLDKQSQLLDRAFEAARLMHVPPVLPAEDLEELIVVALRNRPEIGAATATVAVAETHRRQEHIRPLLPLLSVGYSAGTFGGGSDQADTRFGHFDGRTDFDALAVWSLDNLGFGNHADERRWKALVGQAAAERARVVDRVRREVAEAYAKSAARLQALEVARRQLVVAHEGFQLDLTRARNLEGRPIEVLNSLNLLAAARQELIGAVSGYTEAQFQLFVATGQPPALDFPGASSCPSSPAPPQ